MRVLITGALSLLLLTASAWAGGSGFALEFDAAKTHYRLVCAAAGKGVQYDEVMVALTDGVPGGRDGRSS